MTISTIRAITPLACLVLWTGCDFAPKHSTPEVQTPGAFKELTPEQSKAVDGWKTAQPQDTAIRGNWWETFHDSSLNALETQVAGSNQNVAAALANFQAARAIVKQSRSQYFPTVGAGASADRSHQASPTASTTTGYAAGFDAAWELDLWGRIHNTVEASSREAQATFADLAGVQLTVQAEVAADYFQLRALDAQKRLLEATVISYQESLELTKAQSQAGMLSGQDTAQAEALLNTTRAQLTDLGIERSLLEHAIATLVGTPASLFSIAEDPQTGQAVAIPYGVPSQLLERRPDIAAAERRVAEANAQIGVARAAYFPTITLSGSIGVQGSSLGNLASGPGLVWSVGAALAQTLFDGGKRKAVTEQAQAVYRGTVANYRQTVLVAFQETEDNLSTLRILSQELEQQNAAVDASKRYLALATARYQAGADTYLNVITAQVLLLDNQRTTTNLRMQQMTSSVQLVKALGGGWDPSHPTDAAP